MTSGCNDQFGPVRLPVFPICLYPLCFIIFLTLPPDPDSLLRSTYNCPVLFNICIQYFKLVLELKCMFIQICMFIPKNPIVFALQWHAHVYHYMLYLSPIGRVGLLQCLLLFPCGGSIRCDSC